MAAAVANLAAMLSNLGRSAEALPHHRRALDLKEKVLGPEHPDVALSLNNLGSALDDVGRPAEAVPLFDRALSLREQALGPRHPHVAFALYNRGNALHHLRRDREELADEERAFSIWQAAPGEAHPYAALALAAVGRAHNCLGDRARAASALQRALSLPGAKGLDPPQRAEAQFELARALGPSQRARRLAREAREGYAKADARTELAAVDAWLRDAGPSGLEAR
jgi:tetratricopeptide (TPR) repeat protein